MDIRNKKKKKNIIIEPMSSLWTYPLMKYFDSEKIWIPFVHDIIPHESKYMVFFQKYFYKILNQSKYLGVVSDFSENSLIDRYKYQKNKIIKIKHGIFKYEFELNKKLRSKSKILYFGRIEKYKGIDILLDSFKSLKHEIKDIQLTIAGSGKLNNLININCLPEGVTILNKYLSDEEIHHLFQSHALCVLPYKNATQSGVVALCMGYKMPVIVTNVGALPEQVIHDYTGLIVPPNDVVELSQAIKKLINNERMLKKFSENVEKYADDYYSWDKIAESMIYQLCNLL